MAPVQTKVKRKKTFTGCWTCRSRKVKCDTTKPFCNRCKKAGITCEGYDIKLRWYKPIRFSRDGTQIDGPSEDPAVGNNYFQRRNIDFVKYPKEMIYTTYEDIDKHLSTLHSAANLSQHETKQLGPFAVFKGNKNATSKAISKRQSRRNANSNGNTEENLKRRKPQTPPLAPAPNNFFNNDQHDIVTMQQLFTEQFPHQMTFYDQQQQPQQNDTYHSVYHEDKDDTQYHVQERDRPFGNISETRNQKSEQTENRGEVRSFNDIKNIYDLDPQVRDDQKKYSQFINFLEMTDSGIKYLPQNLTLDSKSIIVSLPITRFLLTHYSENVADLMTVHILPRNPWKTVYLPRALKALGDLCAFGKCSFPNHCTLHAILSISAFHLKNLFERNSPGYKYWRQIGQNAKNIASDYLNKSIDIGLDQHKYKDVLVSILSMSTIDVASGTMRSCRKYLKLCGGFIENRMGKNKKLSAKAKTLHRIFSLSNKIFESTQFGLFNDIEDDEDQQIQFDLDDNSGTSLINKPVRRLSIDLVSVIADDPDTDDGELRPRIKRSVNVANAIYYNCNILFDAFEVHKIGHPSSRYFPHGPLNGLQSHHRHSRSEREVFVGQSKTFREKINEQGRISIEYIVNSNHGSPTIAPQSPKFIDVANQNFASSPKYNTRYETEAGISSKNEDTFFSLDALFGLPNSLIGLLIDVVELFKRKTELTDLVIAEKGHVDPNMPPEPLNQDLQVRITNYRNQVNDFEELLNSWTLEWNLWESPDKEVFLSTMHEGTYHHLMSFKLGIDIYFYRIIKRISYYEIEPYIRDCLYHLFVIKRIIDDNQAVMVPIYWQAFIAACETSDPLLQKQFSEWCERMSHIGINDHYMANKIIRKVWEEKKKHNDDSINWIHILRDYDVSLMLI